MGKDTSVSTEALASPEAETEQVANFRFLGAIEGAVIPLILITPPFFSEKVSNLTT